MWHTIAEEKKLRADADGIRSKFRATTPAEIIICEKSGNRIKKYDLTDSVWARIGLVPTKVDLEKSNRDFQKTIHAAAKAIRNAMNFAPNLANLESLPRKRPRPARLKRWRNSLPERLPMKAKRRHKGNGVTETCPKRQKDGRQPAERVGLPALFVSAVVSACSCGVCQEYALFISGESNCNVIGEKNFPAKTVPGLYLRRRTGSTPWTT